MRSRHVLWLQAQLTRAPVTKRSPARPDLRWHRRIDGLAPGTRFAFDTVTPKPGRPYSALHGVVVGPGVDGGVRVQINRRVEGRARDHEEEWSGAVYVLPLPGKNFTRRPAA